MNDSDDFALVPKPPEPLDRAAMEPKCIKDDMDKFLDLANRGKFAPTQARFRLGDYEWREPDYRQIISWAEQQAVSPEDIINSLLDGEIPSGVPWAGTVFENGRIKKLNWDFDRMSVPDLTFIDGLHLTHLSVCSSEYAIAVEEADLESLPHFKLTLADLPLLTHFSSWESPFFDQLLCSGTSVPFESPAPFNPAIFAPNLQVLECHGYIDVRSLLHLKQLRCDGKILQRPDQHFNSVKA